jgi:hypothetical protein
VGRGHWQTAWWWYQDAPEAPATPENLFDKDFIPGHFSKQMQFLVVVNGQQCGPYSPQEVRQYLATGQLQPQMLALSEGMKDWQPLETFPEFAPRAARTGRKSGRSRTPLYASLAVGAVALCAMAVWLLGRGKQSSGAEATTAESPAPSSIIGHPDWPKTLAELNQWYAEPPPGQNAAQIFMQGYDAMSEQVRANSKNVNLPYIGAASAPSPGSPVPAAMKTAMAAFMQENKAAWDFFKQGSSFAQSRYPLDFTKGAYLLLPHLAPARQATQVAEVFALGYADTQHGKEAGESLLIGFAIGRSLEAEPQLISQLVRVACYTGTFGLLKQTLNRVALPPQTLTQLQEVLGRMVDREASGENFNRAFVREKLDGLAIFDMPPKKLQETLGSLGTNLPNDTNGLTSNLPNNALKNANADRQFFVDSWDQVFAARKEPFPARLKADDIVGQRASEAETRQLPLANLLLQGLEHATSVEAQDLARLRLAQTAVALERFRAASGNRYPADLAELSPKFLASVPEDPFDGQALRYTNSGNGYTLHSIGPPGASDAIQRSFVFTVSNPPKPDSATP